ncbi:hypothetical protein FDF74_09875 [Clostridium niameyense]|uniref:Dipeptidyl-peptidase IV n=1 Tax=Clostridium niameyense TaxID=1622073 RepID=A0A6M0RDU2_9CLOT|nr:hypothetical protein [Clostridium niameyense]NEZ47498.1 hypothetical protein [Clostridium niameyense]
MKIFKKLIIWIMISLVVQFAGLFYIDRYFLASGGTKIKSKKVTNTEVKEKEAEVSIPEKVEDLDISFNGKYISYFENNSLNIINTKTGEKQNLDFESKKDVSKYMWLPDRNRILYAERKGEKIILNSYDVDKSKKDKTAEFDLQNSSSKVEDIQVAPLPNVIYVKVNSGGTTSKIYNINIMKEKKRADLLSNEVKDMKIIPHEDTLIYESKRKIYSTNRETSLNIEGIKSPKLLSIDDNDKIYIGEMKDDKIVKICYGNLKEKTSNWKTLDISNPSSVEDIYVSPLGQVYVNNNMKGTVTNLNTGKETKYTGTIIKMYIDGITSICEGKLLKTKFN